MDKKQRFNLLFTMVSLTMMLLFFQNCSNSEGLFSGDSLTDGFITDPPVIFASKSNSCITPSTLFKVGEAVYICIQNAGTAPKYCHTTTGSNTCSQEVVSTANGWGYLPSGTWNKGFATSVNSPNTFWAGYSYTSYAIHTDDPTAYGQTTFTITN